MNKTVYHILAILGILHAMGCWLMTQSTDTVLGQLYYVLWINASLLWSILFEICANGEGRDG